MRIDLWINITHFNCMRVHKEEGKKISCLETCESKPTLLYISNRNGEQLIAYFEERILKFKTVSNGEETILTTNITLETDKWYHIGISHKPSTIDFFKNLFLSIDGKKSFEGTLPYPNFKRPKDLLFGNTSISIFIHRSRL